MARKVTETVEEDVWPYTDLYCSGPTVRFMPFRGCMDETRWAVDPDSEST